MAAAGVPPLGHDQAVARIVADRGRRFDPALVEAFLAAAGEFDRVRARLAEDA